MKTLYELHYEAKMLNLVTEADYGKFTKEMLMDMLAAHYRERDISRPALLTQLKVMLAREATDLKEDKFEAMISNVNNLWVAEEKLDGVRAKLHLLDEHNRLDSRGRSDITYEYVEKTDSLPHLKYLPHDLVGTVIDGELRMPTKFVTDGKTQTESYLTATTAVVNSSPERAIALQAKFGDCHYFMFDVLFYHGTDVRDLPYEKRYKKLLEIKSQLGKRSQTLHLPVRADGYFGEFRQKLIDQGAEGVIMKRRDWLYEATRSKGWFKWTKEVLVDCFVTGYTPGKNEFSGLVGSLLVSVLVDGQVVEIGSVQPGDLAYRQKITTKAGELVDDIYGKVLRASYLCKTKNN